ncbi:MAG TPA: TRAP transporter small permease [Casimicrobiaceae bacterium]|jgi:TRAP-type C4-dicarboxylate transport system permease small subunit
MKRFESTLANVFGIIFLALSVIVTVETITRKVFGFSLQGADELGGYALAVGSTLAFSLALMGRNHIRVDVFHELFSRRVKAGLNWISVTMIALFAVVIAVVSVKIISETVEYGSTAQTPWATPLIYPQSMWYAGFILFMLVAIGYAARATYLLFTGQLDELNVEFHPKSAKEELKEELEDLEHRQAVERAVDTGASVHTGVTK